VSATVEHVTLVQVFYPATLNTRLLERFAGNTVHLQQHCTFWTALNNIYKTFYFCMTLPVFYWSYFEILN